jgi:hypothetical protein
MIKNIRDFEEDGGILPLTNGPAQLAQHLPRLGKVFQHLAADYQIGLVACVALGIEIPHHTDAVVPAPCRRRLDITGIESNSPAFLPFAQERKEIPLPAANFQYRLSPQGKLPVQ